MPKTIGMGLDEMWRKPYGECGRSCEPTTQQIKAAIDENHLETRAFQEDTQVIVDECREKAGGNVEKLCDLMTKYHAERVAYFVVNGWNPIKLKENSEIDDGSHRYLAAKYRAEMYGEQKTIDVEVNDDSAIPSG